MALDAVVKRLEEIGEHAKRVEAATLAGIPGVDWAAIKGMRDVLAHGYQDVDADLVADTVRFDLLDLVAAVEAALAA